MRIWLQSGCPWQLGIPDCTDYGPGAYGSRAHCDGKQVDVGQASRSVPTPPMCTHSNSLLTLQLNPCLHPSHSQGGLSSCPMTLTNAWILFRSLLMGDIQNCKRKHPSILSLLHLIISCYVCKQYDTRKVHFPHLYLSF